MRPRLHRLLGAAGVSVAADGSLPWDRVIVVNSIGPLAANASNIDRNVWNRGLQVVLLDERFQPTHYCKFRALHPQLTRHRESMLLEAFSAHPASSGIVPHTRLARDDRLEVQVARFVSGERLDRVLPGLSLPKREALAESVLASASTLAAVAREIPDLAPRLQTPVSILSQSESALALLPRMGVEASDVATIRWALAEAGEVPPVSQHRDLWPKNLVLAPDGTCLIMDLDEYGDVVVPLYDAFHYVRSGSQIARPDDTRLWLLRVADDEASARMMRTILTREAARQHLSIRQTLGCLLYYLVDFPVSIHLRETPEAFWGRYRDELPVVAAWLREAGSLDALAVKLRFSDAPALGARS